MQPDRNPNQAWRRRQPHPEPDAARAAGGANVDPTSAAKAADARGATAGLLSPPRGAGGIDTRSWLLGNGSLPATAAERRRRLRMLAASLGLQVGFAVLLAFGFFNVKPVAWGYQPESVQMLYVPLPPAQVVPNLVPPVVAPPRRARTEPVPRPRPTPRLPPPEMVRQVASPRPQPRAPSHSRSRTLALAAPELRPRPVPRVDPVRGAAVARVEMGRFGAPNGIRPDQATPLPVPQIGRFGSAADPAADPPPGAAAVAPSGFGNAGAAPPDYAAGAPGQVRMAKFGSLEPAPAPAAGDQGRVSLPVFDSAAPTSPSPAAPNAVAAPGAFEPPQVLGWPKPVYTPAAIRHRVQGEVVLRVRLCADGTVEILDVQRGLGYGLDSAARAAARKIRFRPARRRGQPVDWTGIVRIEFELAE